MPTTIEHHVRDNSRLCVTSSLCLAVPWLTKWPSNAPKHLLRFLYTLPRIYIPTSPRNVFLAPCLEKSVITTCPSRNPPVVCVSCSSSSSPRPACRCRPMSVCGRARCVPLPVTSTTTTSSLFKEGVERVCVKEELVGLRLRGRQETIRRSCAILDCPAMSQTSLSLR